MTKIVVLGGGESGVGAAVLAQLKGYDVFVSDLSAIAPHYKTQLLNYNIPFEENQHSEQRILSAHEVIKSPGIPDKAPMVQKILAQGIPVISEIEFAGRHTSSKMICITGSNGKTTTTSLIYHILKSAGLDVGLAGNIGSSLALQVAVSPHAYYVVEISSFQLDNMYDFRAHVAILLNITPDHLDRYNYQFANYIQSKLRITQNQTVDDCLIYWENDPEIVQGLQKLNLHATLYPFALKKNSTTCAYIENESMIIKNPHSMITIPVNQLSLQGIHNTYNSMAAGLAAAALNVKKEVIRQSLLDFKGVEHRLEYVATVRNIQFVNDSKATNVNSCWYALQSMKTPVVLILGGTDKGNDYSEIASLVKEKVKAMVFLGLNNDALFRFFGDRVSQIVEATTMEEAVNLSYRLADEGDTVLLSPCCASFDLFQNYEDRGNQFKTCVRNL